MVCSLRPPVVLALAALAVLTSPVAARADDEPRADVRVERACSAGSTIRLRVRALDDDELRVDVRVSTPRGGARWRVVVVHERRLVARATRRTRPRSGAFSLRLALPDWPGRDLVTARALGPRGEICRATVAVAEAVD